MGKLNIKVHKCHLYRPASSGNCAINPRVTVVVDGTYRFQTHVKKNTFTPEYEDSFLVGNTHRLAVVEVSVYDVQEPSGLVLPGIGIFTAKRGMVRASGRVPLDGGEAGATAPGAAGISAGNGGGGASSKSTAPVLLGRCYVSIQRLVHHERKRRTFYLATPLAPPSATAAAGRGVFATTANLVASASAAGSSAAAIVADVGPSLLMQSLPPGIAGTITISLESDTLGESPSELRLDRAREALFLRRLRRFFMCHDQPKVAMLDVIMAHVRDPSEVGGPRGTSGANRLRDTSDGGKRGSRNSTPSKLVSQTTRPDAARAPVTPTGTGAATPHPERRLSSRAGSVTSLGGRSISPPLLSVRDHSDVVAATPTSQSPRRVLSLAQGDNHIADGDSAASGVSLRKRSVCLGGRAELTMDIPDGRESFEAMMRRLCDEYGTSEPPDYRVVMRVEGCTNINKDEWNLSLLGSDDVFVVFRSGSEEMQTDTAALQGTVVWAGANTVSLDVVDPRRFYVTVILMGRHGSKTYEIGRCYVSAAPLSQGHVSRRNMFLCTGESVTRVAVNGVVHLFFRPVGFGLTPPSLAESVDGFYDRLSRFFKRYDPLRLPEVDVLAKSRLHEIETYMKDLVVEYGREPGSVRLLVTVDSLISLRATADTDLSGQNVRVIITMGSTSVRTKAFAVRQFAPTTVRENYMFDVVRETDLIRIEVVNARKEDIVYGRVDFSCLNTQRGVVNKRDLYLVGAAGTPEAYFSGIVRMGLYSDEVGHKYEVDIGLENTFAGRLRRYVFRRVPESLHRVNLAVATVFDMESFMAQLSVEYGDEDPSYALYFTVVGCRQLRSGFGSINPYVVVRVGIDAYQTKTAKANEEPDYFEFCQFYYDRPGDMAITLVVMDQADIGSDEEIGRAVVPLADVQPSRQYNDWLPLLSEKKNGKVREVGTIGFKYTVVDLDLIDHTRARLVKQQYRERHGRAQSLMEGSREARGTSVGPSAAASGDAGSNTRGGGGGGGASQRWSSFKRYFHPFQYGSGLSRANSAVNSAADGSERMERSGTESVTHVVNDADSNSFKSGRSGTAYAPTMNLMDGGIGSVEDFCSAEVSQLNSGATSEAEGDLPASLDMAYVPPSSGADLTAGFPSSTGDAPDAGGSRMQLLVRLLSCTSLFKPGRNLPNPYVLLSTICESHRSQVRLSTTEPRFNETFRFAVEDPNIDHLSITVLTDTPYGSKKLGHCVLSLRNVQCGAMRTRWTLLVVRAFQANAAECGSVYLSIGAINFGMNYLPSADAENRLREQIREHLVTRARRQLHRLEWFVGEFSQLESILLGGWFRDSGHGADGDVGGRGNLENGFSALAYAVADLELTVHAVTHLYTDSFLAEGSCVVKARVDGHTRDKTRPITGTLGSFLVPEGQGALHFTVADPATTLVRLSVILNGKTSAGDCHLSLADLHRGVPKQRTLMLVAETRNSHAEAVGLIRVSVMSSNYGSSAPAPTEEELALHSRLTRYFYYYIPSELKIVDVKYATTLNVAAYLQRLVEKYGPEPGNFHLRFTVDRCRNLSLKRDDTPRHIFCTVRIGLQEFQSSIVEGVDECVFCETFDLVVGLPAREKVELILMRYYPSKLVVLGRTHLELNTLRQGEENPLELALVTNAGTKSASVVGLLKVSAFPVDFGRDFASHLRSRSTVAFGLDGNTMMAQTMYLFRPESPSTGGGGVAGLVGSGASGSRGAAADDFCEVDQSALRPSMSRIVISAPPGEGPGGQDGDAAAQVRPTGRQSSDGAPGGAAVVTIVGFAGLTMRDTEIYLRVSERDRVLLKTRPVPVDKLVALDASTATFTIESIAANYDKVYTLKLGFRKLLGAEALCYADFCVTRCPAGRTIQKRLRLYDMDSQFLGICRLSVTIPNVRLPRQQWQHLSPIVFEPLMDDVASLVATYMPKDLRRLDVALCHTPDIRRLHHGLRRQLAPSVVATVYVAVHALDLHSATVRHACVVTAAMGHFTSETARRQPGASPVYPYGMSREGISKLDFPLLRIDISATGPAALLTLCVCDRASKARTEELGRTVLSLRALLTPAVYDMSEKVQVPLVAVRHAANRVHASLMGTITVSLLPPAFESYGGSTRFASSVVEGFDRAYVRYYMNRIQRLLSHYDANSLTDLHARLFETYVSCRGWETGLPHWLAELVQRWGPELDKCPPPPPLQHHDDAQHNAEVAEDKYLNDSPTPAELTPVDESREPE